MDTSMRKPWAKDFAQWVPQFIQRIKRDENARKAWRSIQQHCMTRDHPVSTGLVGQAALLMFFSLSKDLRLKVKEQHRRTRQLSALFKRAETAISAATHGPQQRGRGRPRLRPEEAIAGAFNAPWVTDDTNIVTVRDAFDRLKRDTGRDFILDEIRKLIVQSCGPKESNSKELFPLAMLQELAHEYGLRLGCKRIMRLCRCAGINVNERTLARYLGSLKGDRLMVTESLSFIRRAAIPRDEFSALFAPLRVN
jgi:hypothetical protein